VIALFASSILSQDYYGSDNVQRFLGKWNLFRDGRQHSIEVVWNPQTDFINYPAFRIKYYKQPRCQGSVTAVYDGWVKKMKSESYSHVLHIRVQGDTPYDSPGYMDEPKKFPFFYGMLFTQTETTMAGWWAPGDKVDFGWHASKLK
jgi:hypothetical protein